MMLSMLSALCTLAACVDVTPPADFNLMQMAGKWYMVGHATNAQWFVTRKAMMKMSTLMVAPTVEGDLNGTASTLNSDGTCIRVSRRGQKTDTPGLFIHHDLSSNIDFELRVVDVVYDSYIIANINKITAGLPEVVNKLMSRTPEVSAALQATFVKFSLDTGVLGENIVMLPMNLNGECPLL